MKYRLFASLLCVFSLFAANSHAQEKVRIELVGEFVLPTGLKIDGVEFGGISGLDYDAAHDIYYAISDDRSQKAPARFYTLKIGADENGVGSVDIVSTVTLLGHDGKPFEAQDVDPESIRFNALTNSVFWTSEGDRNGRPAIRESRLDGSLIREFSLPDYYLPAGDHKSGIRNNLSFESLAITPDGKTLLAATENALLQDGEKASLEKGSRSRIIAFDIASGAIKFEYAYDTDPIFAAATQLPFSSDNGLSEFIAWGDDLLAVERSYAKGVGNQINFYRVNLDGASDVSGVKTLKDIALAPARKQAVLRIDEGDFGLDIDNIESVTWGPQIGGHRTIVIASDNNFNPAQRTQFIMLSLKDAAK